MTPGDITTTRNHTCFLLFICEIRQVCRQENSLKVQWAENGHLNEGWGPRYHLSCHLLGILLSFSTGKLAGLVRGSSATCQLTSLCLSFPHDQGMAMASLSSSGDYPGVCEASTWTHVTGTFLAHPPGGLGTFTPLPCLPQPHSDLFSLHPSAGRRKGWRPGQPPCLPCPG